MITSTLDALAPRPNHVPAERVVDWDVYKQTGPHEDIHLAWKKLHDYPDIIWTPRHGGHWIVTRGEDISFLQRNHDPFSMQDVGVPHGSKPVRVLPEESDPPEHAEYRAVVSPWFTPKKVDALVGYTRELAVDLIEAMAPKGTCEFYSGFALKLPIAIFCKLSNIPWSDKDMLLAWTESFTRGSAEERQQGARAMMGYILQLIESRRAQRGEDILSDIVYARIGGEPISQPDIISMMLNILFGGLDTVASSMSFIAHFLATHPHHRRQIVADPAIIPRAIEEMMRRFGIVSTARTLTRDYDYKGVHFKCGDKVMVPNFMYGLDERQFERPLEVDFSRKNTIHAGFGSGPHRCPGSFLARVEMRVFLEEWFKRIPEFGLKPGSQPEFQPGGVNCIGRLELAWPAGQ